MTVNDIVATIGQSVDPEHDVVMVDGVLLPPPREESRTVMLNKPLGFVTTCRDPHAERIVTQLVDDSEHLYPVGRLDADTEGLLLLTDDGDLANLLTHPRYEVPKVYRVLVDGDLDAAVIREVEKGIELDGMRTAPCKIREIRRRLSAGKTELQLTLIEGRKRQIRRMFEAVGHRVRRIYRLAIGPLELGDLPTGKWRNLTKDEIAALRAAAERMESGA